MIPQVTAAALAAENKQRVHPASVDSIPTSANQEDHVSMAAHAARRIPEMVANLDSIVAIELVAAAARVRVPSAAQIERGAGKRTARHSRAHRFHAHRSLHPPRPASSR